MKARQFARMLEFEDEDTGLRIKRLWSFHDDCARPRFYADILEMPDEQRKRLIRQYARFLKQLRAVRRPWPTTSPASSSSTSIPATPKTRRRGGRSGRSAIRRHLKSIADE